MACGGQLRGSPQALRFFDGLPVWRLEARWLFRVYLAANISDKLSRPTRIRDVGRSPSWPGLAHAVNVIPLSDQLNAP